MPVNCNDNDPCPDDSCDDQAGGFLCKHENSDINCPPTPCGNGVIDPGEPAIPNLDIDPVT